MVSIIIVSYNTKDLLLQTLHSLRENTLEPYEVILVDNRSTDGTREAVSSFSQAHPDYLLQCQWNDHNLGFAKANNLGCRLAHGELLCFLNNDVLLTRGWLEELVAVYRSSPDIGAVGPRSNFVGGPQLWPQVPYSDEAGLQQFNAANVAARRGRSTPCWRLVGFCLLTGRNRLDQVGLFDESFAIGNYEDTDLCLRLVLAGYTNLICEGSFVHHIGNQTFATNHVNQDSWLLRNGRLFSRKWEGRQGQHPAIDEALAVVRHQNSLFLGRKTLSTLVLLRDEEANIDPLFSCLTPLADEIIVMDTGSQDGTLAALKQHPCTVLERPFDGDFAKARNKLLEKARCDWVFTLDADERLAPLDQAKILALLLLPEYDERYDGFRFLQRNYTDDADLFGFQAASGQYEEELNFSGYMDIPATRLFKRRPNIYYKNRANEHVEESILNKQGRLGQVELPIHHYGLPKLLHRFWFRFNLVTLERQRGNVDAARSHLAVASGLASDEQEREMVSVMARNLGI